MYTEAWQRIGKSNLHLPIQLRPGTEHWQGQQAQLHLPTHLRPSGIVSAFSCYYCSPVICWRNDSTLTSVLIWLSKDHILILVMQNWYQPPFLQESACWRLKFLPQAPHFSGSLVNCNLYPPLPNCTFVQSMILRKNHLSLNLLI